MFFVSVIVRGTTTTTRELPSERLSAANWSYPPAVHTRGATLRTRSSYTDDCAATDCWTSVVRRCNFIIVYIVIYYCLLLFEITRSSWSMVDYVRFPKKLCYFKTDEHRRMTKWWWLLRPGARRHSSKLMCGYTQNCAQCKQSHADK